MKAQFFEFGQITERKEVQKFVNGHGNENKGKETTPTCQGIFNNFECTLKSLHKALETKNVQNSLSFELLKSSRKCHSSLIIQTKILYLSKHRNRH
jgi:hypothetical protein